MHTPEKLLTSKGPFFWVKAVDSLQAGYKY